MQTSTKFLAVVVLTTCSALHAVAADPVIIESRKVDGTLNTPAWTEVSGKWTTSKNKSRVSRTTTLVATNVSACATNLPVPAFRVSPAGLEVGATYQVEVTFSTTASHVAAPNLVVAVSTTGLAASTLPTNTPALGGSGADSWNILGTITPVTDAPALTFTYVSGTLSKESRWYADAIRFTRQAAAK